MKNFFLYLVILFPVLLISQVPQLEVPDKKGNYKEIPEVSLENLEIQTSIAGNLSVTTMTMVFKNNSSRTLEGRLTFPLPDGVSVSGYALDINGKLRNAVPVEKEKAKEVFESIERRGVDPGIIEKVQGNNFRTRIYPFMPKSTRTIQVSYQQEIKGESGCFRYFLPLDYTKEIPNFKLGVSVFESFKMPELHESPDGSFRFEKNGNVWKAEITKTNYLPKRNLTVDVPKNEAGNIVMQPASENHYYFSINPDMLNQSHNKIKPKTIGLIWDNSLSGLKKNHEKEFELLNLYLKHLENVSVKLYLLNNEFESKGTFEIKNGEWSSLKNTLNSLVYDGGTDFGKLDNINGVDEYLLFSDGMSTYGDLDKIPNQPVYSIVSSSAADFSLLRYLSTKSGGEIINLQQNKAADELNKLTRENLKFIGIKDNGHLSEVYPQIPEIADENLNIFGIMKGRKTEITLLFGFGNKVTNEKTVVLDADKFEVKDWDISKFWAQKKISELELQPQKNKEDIKEIGKQFNIVTANTSLIVLENVSDYVRYEITPPDELRAEYDRQMKGVIDKRSGYRNDMMAKAEKMMEELKTWWNTDFSNWKKKYPDPKKQNEQTDYDGIEEEGEVMLEEVAVAAYTVREDRAPGEVRILPGVRIDPASGENKKMEDKTPSGKITKIDLKSDEKYMDAFKSLEAAEDIYKEYLKQRENYLETPVFYFDISKLLFDKKDIRLGMKVLSSVADLGIEDEELYKLLAYKLKEIQAYDKELWVLEKVLEWRPFDPQSYRDYALALEENGRFQEALDHLYTIFNKSYTFEQAGRDFGIEETVLMEINELISRYKKDLNISEINPKLIADLPVDIRVILNWNKDNTDIDLWVTDPNGEKCMYSHKKTIIGGRLSKDFTGGFGPEQFILKNAIPGTYKVETNFYSERQTTVSGPTTVMAEVYIYYASGKQKREIIVLNKKQTSREHNKNNVLIAEFEF